MPVLLVRLPRGGRAGLTGGLLLIRPRVLDARARRPVRPVALVAVPAHALRAGRYVIQHGRELPRHETLTLGPLRSALLDAARRSSRGC